MKLLIAERQALMRGALRALLESHGHHVVAVASSEDDAYDFACRHAPDVVLMDLEGAPFEMMAAARRISSALPHIAVVLLAGLGEGDLFLDALSCGARGFVTRDLDEELFCTLLERAALGEIVVASGVAAHLLDVYSRATAGGSSPRRAMTLTHREHDVLSRMTHGQTSNRELAEALGLSENTVRFHVRNLLEKFHLHSRAAVVAYACSHDVVGPGDSGSQH